MRVNSAGGSAKQGRDRKFQAILPIQGKLINVETARGSTACSAHDEIKTMITALGTGIGGEDFDINKLRYSPHHHHDRRRRGRLAHSHAAADVLLPADAELVEHGHIYIAQPPLFRAKRGRQETYIKDERALENFVVNRAVNGPIVKTADGVDISGAELEKLLHGMIAYRNILRTIERRGHARDVIEALLDRDARGRTFFENQQTLHGLADQLTTPVRDVTLQRDEEHNAWILKIDDRATGYSRIDTIGPEFVTSRRVPHAGGRVCRDRRRASLAAQGSDRSADDDEWQSG